MNVLVTGATGFIGKHVIDVLLERGYNVFAMSRNIDLIDKSERNSKIQYVQQDFKSDFSVDFKHVLTKINAVIHLAWEGLPNYKSSFHYEVNLFNQFFFLKKIISEGINNIIITGTCLEYGMKNGELHVEMTTDPINAYAIAKDSLRKCLFDYTKETRVEIKWLRLFYMFGNGQSKQSILSQLDLALENGDEIFNMSKGDQERDYLHVSTVAQMIVNHLDKPFTRGIYNICSGSPIKILDLVNNHLKSVNKTIKLNIGYYSYNEYEPHSFWGKK
jgi:dTDP-6-deoxy-L-talose 4-dehydrogenase (NAD+)